jgi:hypothetical protein
MPRWLFVLAAATPQTAGDPILVDESLEQIVPDSIMPGDIVGISVHTGNVLRGYEVGRMTRERGAWVIYGGIHARPFPEETLATFAASGGPMVKKAAAAPLQSVIDEIVNLRRIGFRFFALADDNFYPVTLTDLRLAKEQNNITKLEELTAIRTERFQLMAELAKLPKDMVFFRQITMEAGEDGEYLDAMRKANIKGALVGVEAVTPEGLKAVFKDFNYSGEAVADVQRARCSRARFVHLRASDSKPATFDATVEMALKAGVTFAQFVMMTQFPGTVDFARWEKVQAKDPTLVGDVPITRYWLILTEVRPKMFTPHPTMNSDEIRDRTQQVWDRFYNWSAIWQRSACTPTLRARVAFMFLSKLYRPMYAGTGISTDSARRKKSKAWARWTARECRKLFLAKPMPELQSPARELSFASPSHLPAFLRT